MSKHSILAGACSRPSNRHKSSRRALNVALHDVAELFDLQTSWIFLLDAENKFYLAAAQNLPPAPRLGLMHSSRRDFLQTTGCGFGYLAWQAMAQSQAALANPMATKKPPADPPAESIDGEGMIEPGLRHAPATPDPAFAPGELARGYGRSMNGMRPPAAAPSPLG